MPHDTTAQNEPAVIIIKKTSSKKLECSDRYSKFSVNMPPIDCCKKVKIPGTTSLPKLC